MGGFPKFPTVVAESGINEPHAELQENARLWQEGTAGAVRVVLQVQFSAATKESKIRLLLSVPRFRPDGHPTRHDYYTSFLLTLHTPISVLIFVMCL